MACLVQCLYLCCVCALFSFYFIFIPTWYREGVTFSLQFVCVCVWERVCRSVCLSVNKFPAKLCTHLDVVLCQMVAYFTGCNPIEIGDFWLKVKITVTKYRVFHHNSLLTFLLCLSTLLCSIKKWNLACYLDMPLVDSH